MRSQGIFTQSRPKSKVQVLALSMRYSIWEALTYISEAWTSHICICYLGKCENLDFSTRLAYEQFLRIFKHIWLHHAVIRDFHSKSSLIKSPGFHFKHEIFDLRSLYMHIWGVNKPYLYLLPRKMQKPGLFDTFGLWAICKDFQPYLASLCGHKGFSLKVVPNQKSRFSL